MLCVSLVQNNLLLSIYNMNDEQTGQSWDQHLGLHLWHTYCRRRMLKSRAGLFSAHHVSGLCLCHINIQLYPICPVNSLSIVAKGGGQCQHYLCQYRHFITSVSLCSGCWLLLHRVCPWDDCSVQGHSVCVCVWREYLLALFTLARKRLCGILVSNALPRCASSLSSSGCVQNIHANATLCWVCSMLLLKAC